MVFMKEFFQNGDFKKISRQQKSMFNFPGGKKLTKICSCLQVDLQTSSQRLLLTGVNTNPQTELKSEQSIDDVIQHEVKELGTHM